MFHIWQYMSTNLYFFYWKATEFTDFTDIAQVIEFVNEYLGIKVVQGHCYHLYA
jgi:hypothetical protein